jgi:hypothetical protein
MTHPQVNNPTTQKPHATTPKQTCQPYLPKQSLTEERIKEVVTDMLIALDLIPKAQKKKVIANV